MWTHVHIYLFLKQNLWEERKMICKWYLDITSFLNFRSLISEKEIQGPAHGWDVPINMGSWRELKPILNSEYEKAWKRKWYQGGVGNSQVHTDEGEPAHYRPCHPRSCTFKCTFCTSRKGTSQPSVSGLDAGSNQETWGYHASKSCTVVFFLNQLMVVKNYIGKNKEAHI